VADIIELVGGWSVAGLVTTGGVLLAHWVQERSRQKREDRLGIYGPLRREMLLILSEPDRARGGRWMWAEKSHEFYTILSRGDLFPKRHADLKKDVDELLRLYAEYEAKLAPFQRIREEALKAVWESTDIVDETGINRKLADVVLGHNPVDETLNTAITSGDKDSWVARFTELMSENGKRLGARFEPPKPLRPKEKKPEFVLGKMGEQLFETMDMAVRESRDAYRQSVEAFLAAAERLKAGLEKALRDGRTYRTLSK